MVVAEGLFVVYAGFGGLSVGVNFFSWMMWFLAGLVFV